MRYLLVNYGHFQRQRHPGERSWGSQIVTHRG